MAKIAANAAARITRSLTRMALSSWRGFTPLPVVIRLSMAKTVPIAASSAGDRPVRRPSARKADSVAKEAWGKT
jgi:hypothetical protein